MAKNAIYKNDAAIKLKKSQDTLRIKHLNYSFKIMELH
jgi:hypothetical protein